MLASMKWNAAFEPCPPRILFLAERNIWVDDPMNDFAAFEEDKIYKMRIFTHHAFVQLQAVSWLIL